MTALTTKLDVGAMTMQDLIKKLRALAKLNHACGPIEGMIEWKAADAIELLSASKPAVPAVRQIPEGDPALGSYWLSRGLAEGWNNCRAEMLAASPAAPAQSGEPVAYTSPDRLKRIAERNRHVDTMWPASMCDEGDVPLYTQLPAQPARALTLGEYHEDNGNVVWWAWENGEWLGEPAWIGTPSDSDWPGYHTHWTPHPEWPKNPPAAPASSAGDQAQVES